MSSKTYDVIVIGAGPGGSTCAALLAKAGMKALLLDKNDRAGGKALTLSSHGFAYELWPVTGGPTRDCRWQELIQKLELDVQLLDVPGSANPLYRTASGEYVAVPTPDGLESFMGFVNDILSVSPEEIEKLDDVTLHDFLSRRGFSQPIYSLAAMMANIVFVVPVDLMAASEFVKTIKEHLASGTVMYFKGGYGKLFEACAAAVERYGSEVLLRTRVERITVADGAVRSVVTDKGTFHAPIVVSNAGIQPTVLKLVGEEHFDTSYANYVKGLVPSLGIMGIRYFLDKPVIERPMYMTVSDDNYVTVERAAKAKAGELPDDVVLLVVVPSNYDPDLAPPGKQCVLVGTLCPPGADEGNRQLFWDKVDETVAAIWPDLPAHVEHKEYYHTGDVSSVTRDHVLPGQGGECIGLGQIVGQCGRHKPSAKAPIHGLFYVGCDAGGYGCGTHQGVDSAFRVAQMVAERHQTRSKAS